MLFCTFGLSMYFGAITGLSRALDIPPGRQSFIVVNDVPMVLAWFFGLFFQYWRRAGRRAARVGVFAFTLLIIVQRSALGIWSASRMLGGVPEPTLISGYATWYATFVLPWLNAVAWCLLFWGFVDNAEISDEKFRGSAHWAVLTVAASIVAARYVSSYLSAIVPL